MNGNNAIERENVKTNSFRAWFLASRPKTLTAAAVPVMLGAAYAWHVTGSKDYGWLPMIFCFLFAFVMQIDANFVNDYFDCVKGADNEERLGPQRACQQGWITLPAMRKGMVVTSFLASLVGLPLVFYGGWELIGVGVLCLLFCFLYTTLLAGKGMGDVLVLIFFGVVPCCFTCYVIVPEQLQIMRDMPWMLAVACGLVVDTLLLVNNYRDIDNDRLVGKRTLVVLLGRKVTEYIYMLIVPVALLIVLYTMGITLLSVLLTLPTLILHIHTWRTMCITGYGKPLNRVLGMTARNIFVFGIMTTLLVITA